MVRKLPLTLFKNLKFKAMKKRYERQGYYSANNGRINLKDLENFCTLVKL